MYDVDYIKARRLNKGDPEYLIKWKGFPDDKDDTWEPLSSLSGQAEEGAGGICCAAGGTQGVVKGGGWQSGCGLFSCGLFGCGGNRCGDGRAGGGCCRGCCCQGGDRPLWPQKSADLGTVYKATLARICVRQVRIRQVRIRVPGAKGWRWCLRRAASPVRRANMSVEPSPWEAQGCVSRAQGLPLGGGHGVAGRGREPLRCSTGRNSGTAFRRSAQEGVRSGVRT
eukprot:3010560-Prymnesium_polylepis.1